MSLTREQIDEIEARWQAYKDNTHRGSWGPEQREAGEALLNAWPSLRDRIAELERDSTKYRDLNDYAEKHVLELREKLDTAARERDEAKDNFICECCETRDIAWLVCQECYTSVSRKWQAAERERDGSIERAAKACQAQMFDGLPVPEHRRGFESAKRKCVAAIRALPAEDAPIGPTEANIAQVLPLAPQPATVTTTSGNGETVYAAPASMGSVPNANATATAQQLCDGSCTDGGGPCEAPEGVVLDEVPRHRHAWRDVFCCPNEGCGKAFMKRPAAAPKEQP